MSAGNQQATKLRVITDEYGRAVQVYVGSVEITHLVVRVQTITAQGATKHEVVLVSDVPFDPRSGR